MTIQMVLLPVFVQVALTLVLIFWMAFERTGSVRRGETKIRDIALRQPAWPERATKISNCFDSQFQLPLLFYVLVVFAWITYKSRAQRDKINAKVMADPRLSEMMDPKSKPPFDGKRMIFGGFESLVKV